MKGHITGLIHRHPLLSLLLIFNTFGQVVALIPVISYNVYGVKLDADLILIIPTFLFLLFPALIITRIADGRDGLRALASTVFRFRVQARWYALAFLVLPVLTVAVQWSAPPGGWDGSTLARAYGVGFLGSLAFNFLTTNWWEETVWMGFFQARLQPRFGALGAALLTSPFFFLEHVTLVFPGSTLGGGWSSILALVILIPLQRITVAYIYNRTGSLATVGLVHAATNAVGFGLMMPLYGTGGSGSLILVIFGLVALVATRGRLGLPRPSAAVKPADEAGLDPVRTTARSGSSR